MAFGARARMVNPRLGTYFSIFAALFTALFLLILIFEQLRLDEHLLKLVFFAGPIVIYAAIGLSVASNDTLNYFASGRRVPALYTGRVARNVLARRQRSLSPAPAPFSSPALTPLF